MKKNKISTILLCGVIAFASFGILFPTQDTHAITKEIVFPVAGPVSWTDTFGAPRVGHTHEGADIFGVKQQPLVAAISGTIRFVPSPEPSYGYYVSIEAPDGWSYNYLHINNDNPGTDDGNGGEMHAYAPDMKSGNHVTAGQLIGWMGDSGNAETTPPHLHFEVRDPFGTAINPTDTLYVARRVSEPQPYNPIDDTEILPFGNFNGGATIALAEMHGGYEGNEIIAAAGPRGGQYVRIIAQDRTVIGQFRAFESTMNSGMDITTGNIDGEDLNEIIVAAGEGSAPRVRIFDNHGVFIREFMAFEDWYRGGVRVTSADLDGDGADEIITVAEQNYAPWVKVYDGEGKHLYEFLSFGEGGFTGGIDVAAYSATETTDAYIVTSVGRGGGPVVHVHDKDGNQLNWFFAYGEGYRGGVRIDIGNIYESDNTPEIAVTPAYGGGPDFRVYSLKGIKLRSLTEYEKWWRSEYDLAVGPGEFFVVSQNSRRVSVRPLL